MRRLGDLWVGEDKEKEFVAKLLLHLARGQPVTDQTWRNAESIWEKAFKDQNDQGKPFPEVKAMIFLTLLITAGASLEPVPPAQG